MNDSIEFTPKEKYLIHLYRDDVDRAHRRSIARRLWILVPPAALVLYGWLTQQPEFGLLGYVYLLVNALIQLSRLKPGLVTLGSIFRKYEAQLQSKGGEG